MERHFTGNLLPPAGPGAQQPLPLESFIDRLGERMIRLEIGPENKKFHAHKNLLCTRSNWFANYLSPMTNDLEVEYGEVIPFPDWDPKVFTIFLEWVYTKQIVLPSRIAPENLEQPVRPDIQAAATAYRLGEFLQSLYFRDAIADKVKTLFKPPHSYPYREIGVIEFRDVVGAYGFAPLHSPLQALFLELALFYHLSLKGGSTAMIPLPETMGLMWPKFEGSLFCMDEEGLTLRHLTNPLLAPFCRYHLHGPQDTCGNYTDICPEPIWVQESQYRRPFR
ncbi:uncharacterized protein BP5553_04832 [Venustampulla echinocandica]|uniref:BTB domain-containing protein n=1 Tax=Venustampulla echinocandica TaxID=2656787 RepID=A0A370TPE5_9HELO|nr:uncharacterized protein BP5553_04832 [Venustampulla echinocandica]RDL37399.1 hypothetical protein BP5553_04832 [Venustampulla echinocandica]